ncbi:MAG TPA: hypothetical protein VGH38_04455, partial [Bryobacteraceae bacterium]
NSRKLELATQPEACDNCLMEESVRTMRFRPLPLICECGQAAETFYAIGFTSEYELVVHWECAACGKLAYMVKPLADCCKECPDPENSPLDDARFLQSLGIKP